jgi:energy-coupling factor transporter ATP-binding protein EcfA2
VADVVYAARQLAPSNLGWWHRTRETLGEASGRERAININREVFTDWFPDREENDASPIEIVSRYLDGSAGLNSHIRSDIRTIRLQGGGKNWRLAGDAVPGNLYDVRVDDLLLMSFDRSTHVLSWIVIKGKSSSDRPVDTIEHEAYQKILAILGPASRSMWVFGSKKASEIADISKSVYANAGEVLMQIKSMAEAWRSDLSTSGYAVVQDVDLRLIQALFSKRFLILTGLSGSGKTLLARSFLQWCTEESGQYAVVAVGANWTSNENVLGYPDALDPERYVRTKVLDVMVQAVGDPNRPYFVILDEMNLSHVERYFADFLSAIESPHEPIFLHSDSKDRSGVPARLASLPLNLFIIGTVNVDETTYLFSPKVLDRANVIEFRTSRKAMESYLLAPKDAAENIATKGSAFGRTLVEAQNRKLSISDMDPVVQQSAAQEILLLFKLMAEDELEFGFRTAQEMTRYFWFALEVSQATGLDGKHEALRVALDHQVLQKVLPRVHGARKRVEPLLNRLLKYCESRHEWQQSGITNISDIESALFSTRSASPMPSGEVTQDVFLPLSHRKIERMLLKLKSTGFVSFAEG